MTTTTNKTKSVKCKQCGHASMDLVPESGTYDYKKNEITLVLEDLPVYVCSQCKHKYYSNLYEVERLKQIKKKLAPLVKYQKILSDKDLLNLRIRLQKTSDQMDIFIGARFGQYDLWEKKEEKIPMVYNLLLKLLKEQLETNNPVNIVSFLQLETNWWKNA